MSNQKQNKVQPLVAAYSKRDQAKIKRANQPEVVWETLFGLLPKENEKRLKSELKQMGIKIGKSKIVALQNDEQWAEATEYGKHPYVLVGTDNFRIIGQVNDKPNKLMISTGKVPSDAKIYADVFHDEKIMVAFPESNVNKATVVEL